MCPNQRGGKIRPGEHARAVQGQVALPPKRQEVQGPGLHSQAHLQQARGEGGRGEGRGRVLQQLPEGPEEAPAGRAPGQQGAAQGQLQGRILVLQRWRVSLSFFFASGFCCCCSVDGCGSWGL